jgi:LPS-assembly lipoprotein
MWRERQVRHLWGALAIGTALFAAGCGFRPLYAEPEPGDTATVEQLAAVRIEPLPDRTGQQLHNFLRGALNPQGQPVSPAYRLEIKLTQRTEELALREDETATRANIILDSAFVLLSMSDEEVLYSGRSSAINSYNILDQEYSTIIAADDALERGLRQMSEDIKLRLAIYFSSAEGQDL